MMILISPTLGLFNSSKNTNISLMYRTLFHFIDVHYFLVQDDPKLLDDGEEIPKSQGRGWRFDLRM